MITIDFHHKNVYLGMELNQILDPFIISLIELIERNERRIRTLIALQERNIGIPRNPMYTRELPEVCMCRRSWMDMKDAPLIISGCQQVFSDNLLGY